MRSRLAIRRLASGDGRRDLALEVQRGLTAVPKSLPCRFFYDEAGSRLFEEICALDEYYVTRAEDEILAAHAADIERSTPAGALVVELGSGNAQKTRHLLDACIAHEGRARYAMVDISTSALETSAAALLSEFPTLTVEGLAAEYQDGLALLATEKREPWLVLWLGSNVGNFGRAEAARFLAEVARPFGPHDRLLLGVDRRKDKRVLEAAYDDARGVTARFNLNLCTRINAELGGRFDPSTFRHVARYDEDLGRVEMYLESRIAQRVRIAALELAVEFAAGERIHTENSYKYSDREIEELAASSGLRVEHSWTDARALFRSCLLARA